MSFKLYKCEGPKGLPLIEAPGGPFVFERLSPGEIREADYYEEFRWGKNGKQLFACPRGQTEKGRCKKPLRLLRIRHNRRSLPGLLKDCRSGELYNRRRGTIDRILKDIEKKNSKSKSGGIGFFPAAETTAGRIVQFVATSVMSAIVAVITIKYLFPDHAMGGRTNV